MVNEIEIKRSAEQFVAQVKSLLPQYNEDFVLNTNQARLQLEFPATRTLSYRGEKTTLATVRWKNTGTPSYTVQPTISMSGKIVGPIYICLKEINDRLSDTIKAKLPQMKNVVVTCSISGKLTTFLDEYFGVISVSFLLCFRKRRYLSPIAGPNRPIIKACVIQ